MIVSAVAYVCISAAAEEYAGTPYEGADTFAEPGTVITIDGSWPYHRASDLTRQRYLEPIAPTPVRRGT